MLSGKNVDSGMPESHALRFKSLLQACGLGGQGCNLPRSSFLIYKVGQPLSHKLLQELPEDGVRSLAYCSLETNAISPFFSPNPVCCQHSGWGQGTVVPLPLLFSGELTCRTPLLETPGSSVV